MPVSPYAAPLPKDIRLTDINDLERNAVLDQELTGLVGEKKNAYVLTERYLDLRVFVVLQNPERKNVGCSFVHPHSYSNNGNVEKKYYDFDILVGKDRSNIGSLCCKTRNQ